MFVLDAENQKIPINQLIQITSKSCLLLPLSKIYSFTRSVLQFENGGKWLCTQPNCQHRHYAYLIIIFASLWTWRSLSEIECLNFTLTLDTNERQPSPQTRILTSTSDISLFHIQTRKSHSNLNESLCLVISIVSHNFSIQIKSHTIAMDTEGDSHNFDYNWDELSVGNFRMNHSNHFFGKIWREFIFFYFSLSKLCIWCRLQFVFEHNWNIT